MDEKKVSSCVRISVVLAWRFESTHSRVALPMRTNFPYFAWYRCRRARKANELGTEPAAGATAVAGEEVSTLMLRLADGTRVRRRFQRSDAIGKVLDWADVQGVDLDTQRLSCSFPKASGVTSILGELFSSRQAC